MWNSSRKTTTTCRAQTSRRVQIDENKLKSQYLQKELRFFLHDVINRISVPPGEGQKSRKWLKKSSKPSKRSNRPVLPLMIISNDTINSPESHGSYNRKERPKRSSRKSAKSEQRRLPIFKLIHLRGSSNRKTRESPSKSSLESRQTDESYDDEISHRSICSDYHDSKGKLCQARRPTRYCGERKRNSHRRSRSGTNVNNITAPISNPDFPQGLKVV